MTVDPRQVWLTHVKGPRPIPELFTPVTGIDCLNKPGRAVHKARGLWTSTWIDQQRISGWADWCGPEHFGGPEWRVWQLTPSPAAQVWEIDTHADLVALIDRYGVEGAMFKVLGRHSMFPEMDFDRFAADGYVGVHLTDEGEWRTRGMFPDPEPSLCGWDCECTLWCRWVFDWIEDLGVLTWHGGEGGVTE